MGSSEQIDVKFSKTKLTFLLLGSLGFVAFATNSIFNHDLFGNQTGSRSLILVIDAVTIIFFGFCGIFFIMKYFDKKPGLSINHERIISGGQSILWADVTNISTINIYGQDILLIHVKNPEYYIDKQSNIFKKKALNFSFNRYGTPLSISSNGLQISFNQLNKLVERFFENSKKLQNI